MAWTLSRDAIFLHVKPGFSLILCSTLHFLGLLHLSWPFKLLTYPSISTWKSPIFSPENTNSFQEFSLSLHLCRRLCTHARTRHLTTQWGQESRSHTTVNRLPLLRLHYLFSTRINLSGCLHSIRNVWKQMKQYETHKKIEIHRAPFGFVRRLYLFRRQ